MKSIAAQTFNIVGGIGLGTGAVFVIMTTIVVLTTCACCFGLMAMGTLDMDAILTPVP